MPAVENRIPNRLIHETSPYLLQHAYNPVDWWPWCDEAFAKAEAEDKPIFLSIGYSTCHWCHVMARESFESSAVASLLNESFVSIKVDKEQRPDIDNLYMRFCQRFTGSGGWPTSIFMDAEGAPFYGGTYYPPGQFIRLLSHIAQHWSLHRTQWLKDAQALLSALGQENAGAAPGHEPPFSMATEQFRGMFDREFGGFGSAPKFPSPHNLMFLLYTAPDMAEKTLLQLYKGGIFDHVGYGFCRYSTDRFWLAPHFEKMLYDNAMLLNAYALAFERTGNPLYQTVAEKILCYISREMTAPGGGFYSAQDADSGGVEGAYYLFTPEETIRVLGAAVGARFNAYFGLSEAGNFEGKNIPNLISSPGFDSSIDSLLPSLYQYRKQRMTLHLDHKIVTSWNALMLAALANAYRIFGDTGYRDAAVASFQWIESTLCRGDTLYGGCTDGTLGIPGFLDEYAFYGYALLCLHQATMDEQYLRRAAALTQSAIAQFYDHENGGFYFSGTRNAPLILRPKETYDNALPSGNSVMAYNLNRLSHPLSEQQNRFMNGCAAEYPMGYGFYLFSQLPVKQITCTLKPGDDLTRLRIKSDWFFRLGNPATHPLIDNQTTYYVCTGTTCLPPSTTLD